MRTQASGKPCTCSQQGAYCRGAATLGAGWYCERAAAERAEWALRQAAQRAEWALRQAAQRYAAAVDTVDVEGQKIEEPALQAAARAYVAASAPAPAPASPLTPQNRGGRLTLEEARRIEARQCAAPVEVLALFGEAPAPAGAEAVQRKATGGAVGLREAARRVIDRVSHTDACTYQRWSLDYSKGRGPAPDDEDCDCGVYALHAALAEAAPAAERPAPPAEHALAEVLACEHEPAAAAPFRLRRRPLAEVRAMRRGADLALGAAVELLREHPAAQKLIAQYREGQRLIGDVMDRLQGAEARLAAADKGENDA